MRYGFETAPSEVYEDRLEELLDRLEVQVQDGGEYASMVYEGPLQELLDRLEMQESGEYLSEVTSSSGSQGGAKRPGTSPQLCPGRSGGAQPTAVLDRFAFDISKL